MSDNSLIIGQMRRMMDLESAKPRQNARFKNIGAPNKKWECETHRRLYELYDISVRDFGQVKGFNMPRARISRAIREADMDKLITATGNDALPAMKRLLLPDQFWHQVGRLLGVFTTDTFGVDG